MTALHRFALLTMACLALRAGTAEAAKASDQPTACLAKLAPDDRQWEQPVDADLRLISRGTPSQGRFYLTSNRDRPDNCGSHGQRTVYAYLEVPTTKNEWVGVSFDCSSADRRVHRGDPLIGVFVMRRSTSPVKARRAWTVKPNRRGFAPVDRATCRSFDQ